MTDDKPTAPPGLIHRASGNPQRVERLGPYIIESLIAPEEERAGTVYRVHIGPHARTAVSFHRVAEEYYFVLSGAGRAVLGGRDGRAASGRLPAPAARRHARLRHRR